MFHTTIKIYLEIPPKIGKKVGIHFYENILSEVDLPLLKEIYQVIFQDTITIGCFAS